MRVTRLQPLDKWESQQPLSHDAGVTRLHDAPVQIAAVDVKNSHGRFTPNGRRPREAWFSTGRPERVEGRTDTRE